MAIYELTLVTTGKTAAAKKKTLQKDIESLIKVNKGTIKSADDWGEIKLAYPIEKSDSGSFVHFTLDLDQKMVKSVDDKMRLNEDVVRYLLVRKDN